jgi:hypothetical protein
MLDPPSICKNVMMHYSVQLNVYLAPKFFDVYFYCIEIERFIPRNSGFSQRLIVFLKSFMVQGPQFDMLAGLVAVLVS